MQWQKISLIGIGLLGGSLGLAIKERKLASRVEGYVRREETLAACRKLNLVDRATLDLQEAIDQADLIIFCTPVGQMKSLAEQILPWVKSGTVVTDVGSVKASVVEDLEPLFASVNACYLGSHPMAGAETAGCAAARSDLFQNTLCVVTPTRKSASKTLKRVEEFWESVGSRVMRLKPEVHDDLISRSSHLPHVVAAELANYILSPVHPTEQAALCSNGFRDTTRIASGSPEMWRDIVLANRKNLGRVLGVFIEDLREFQIALEKEDRRAISEFFEKAKQRRDQWKGEA